jgi:hypothetical protein
MKQITVGWKKYNIFVSDEKKNLSIYSLKQPQTK